MLISNGALKQVNKDDIINGKIYLPDDLKVIEDFAFAELEELEEIIIPDSVTQIGKSAFKNCKALKNVKLSNKLHLLDDFAFSGCESLEEITIPTSLHYFSNGVFSNCYNLKTINYHDNINYIDDLAFYNCKNLNFTLPPNITSIGRMALMGCESIKEIHIPKNVDCIEVGALALMSSLEKITVEENNKKYFTEDDDTVLLSKDGIIIQYAINCEREEFIVGYYMENISTNSFNGEDIQNCGLIYNIADYAFAGAKKLKKIYLNSEVESFGKKTFYKCDNLKDLQVFHSNYGDSFLLNIHGSFDDESEIPFENIVIDEGVKTLCENLADLFKNAKNVSLPQSLEHISGNVFTKSSKLKKLIIPDKIKMIMPNTFYPEIEVTFPTFETTFPDFGTMKAKCFNMLQTKTNENYKINYNDKDNISLFSLTDGTYYVKINEFDTVKVTRDEIANLSDDFHELENEPDLFVSYMIDLLGINAEHSHLLQNVWHNQELEELFHKFVSDLDYAKEIAANKISKAIRDIMENNNNSIEFLFSSVLIKKIKKMDLIKILENYNESIARFFRLSNVTTEINVNRLISYCNLLEKYKRYDKFLYNPIFFQKLNSSNQELLLKHFNKNIKNLLRSSQTLYDMYGENMNDLLNVCNSLGVFSEDKIISQRISTFINEKMFNEESKNSIIGNNIHTVFSGINPRENIDYEFIKFFIENYDKLVELEKNNSGIIVKIYNSFREISNTSTSHKGSQRKLKVTIEKCLDYFSEKKFEGVNENNKELARLLQQYYSEPYTLNVGEMILNQSQKAPRNIFTKILFDNEGNPIYDHNHQYDLKETTCVDNFSYHWLPKQDYDNLILGKYCGCCAHILGAGAGIMRASMILDNCQNLVIRNHEDKIIAKMTIYVNRENGYAVFNTAEVNVLYHNDIIITGIYKAFMRGVNAFVKKYNENNQIPISIVTMGEYRNSIKYQLGNIESDLFPTPNYSEYSYSAGGTTVGTYNGDSKNKQILVLKI